MHIVLRLLIIIAVPVVLTMGLVRLMTLPWYPAWAYRQAWFPDDPLGLEMEARLQLARGAIRSLNVPRGPDLLRDLSLPDGGEAFNEREIEHMVDVKRVYDGLTLAAGLLLVAGAVAGGWLRRRETCGLWTALLQGGALTLAILVGLGIWMVVGFNAFFTTFHGLFFEAGTWVFKYSDTLIRLFPIEFWQAAGLMVAGGVSLLALLLVIVGRWQRHRCKGGA
jgi:integral membrane protein (TIGR01906 family)